MQGLLPLDRFPLGPVQYLLSRKYRDHLRLLLPPAFSGSSASAEERTQCLEEIKAYEAELRAKPPAELQELCDRERAEERLEAEREEPQRFFHQPQATADLEHWSRAAYWTLDEAVALSFGKAPEAVNWQLVRPFVAVSPFAMEYQRRRDLMLRAKNAQQLFDPVLPGVFLAWAERNDIDVPEALEAAARVRGHQVADWKSRYDELSAQMRDERAAAAQAFADKDAESAVLVRERDTLRERVVQLEQAAAAERPVSTKERETDKKLLIAMAVRGYGYDPTARRSDTVKEIVCDLDHVGLHLDEDTVRKRLRDSAGLLPRDHLDDGAG